jgi:type III pantothenate kinase
MEAMDFVADAGNTRLKWGRLVQGAIVEVVSLDPAKPDEWEAKRLGWAPQPGRWCIAGTHPARRDTFSRWLTQRGEIVRPLTDNAELPIVAAVDFPAKVGIDRLLNALAARARHPGQHLIVVDAGTAVTVDTVDAAGVFQGGSILPGFQLLAKSLHDYTALLPLVDLPANPAELALPGKNTQHAIQTGIYWEAVGGVVWLCEQLATRSGSVPRILMTGGDAERLRVGLGGDAEIIPSLTLEGIAIAAGQPQ